MEEKEEICRVCRSEGTAEEPLFHPCKCSGSIRFIHQECLMDWLSHSKKKYCELCNHYYKFTPVYKKDMPATIPKKIFLEHLKNMLSLLSRWLVRACLVSFIWLGLVPFITVWIWRFYFWNADTTHYLFTKYFLYSQHNQTSKQNTQQEQINVWTTIMYDCLEGWLIAFIVTAIFIAGFLLREWVLQNVPMELQEEGEEEEEQQEEVVAGLQPPLAPALVPAPVPTSAPTSIPALAPAPVEGESTVTATSSQPQREIHTSSEAIQPRVRRGRIGNSRRPPLLQEPSDYENLQAMWLMDEAQVSPPLQAQRDPFDLDQESEDDDDEDDDGYFDESEEEEPVNSERVREIMEAIRRRQEQNDIPDVDEPPPPPPVADNNHNDIPANNGVDIAVEAGGGPEDIDGLLEAIGMKGSIYMLFQNSGLMTLLMSLCLGVGIWLPYILGVFFITIRPWDGFMILTEVVRSLSDPTLDYVSDRWLEFYSQLDPVSEWLPKWTPALVRSVVLTAAQIGQTLIKFFSTGITGANKEFPLLNNSTTPVSSSLSPDILVDPASMQSYTVSLWHDIIFLIEYMAPSVRSSFEYFVKMPTGNTAMDRVGCILTGYVILVIIGSLYLSRTQGIYARIGRTARQIIRQLGILLKVAFFITIEITLFPLCCGLLLDCVALSLFYKIGAEGHLLAIHKRMTFLKENMASSLFMHWVIGTGFMFLFTSMVTFCRDIVRPGVLWFIRDPNDSQFNPIKEWVERPVPAQLRKFGASAIIYGFVIEFGVGGLVAIIGAIFDGILPLKWSYTQPLTILPIDLLVVMLVVPAMIDYFDPKQLLEKLTIRWITWLSHQLRLTSFLLGGRPIKEEGYVHYKTWKAWIQRPESSDTAEDSLAHFIRNGQLVRAPRHDGVQYVPGRRMLIPVDPDTLEPLDPSQRRLTSEEEGEEENTTIVYLPPQFKLRMAIFMVIMWISWSALLCYIFVGPIAVGRWLFEYVGIVASPGRKIHDIYAYFFGGCVMIFVGVLVKRLKKWVLRTPSNPFAGFKLDNAKKVINAATLFVYCGILLPILFGCLLELYFIIPLKNLNNNEAPILNVVSIYLNGLVILTLAQCILSMGQFNFLQSIGPIIKGCLGAILLPYSLIVVRNYFIGHSQVWFLQVTYPFVLLLVVLYYLSRSLIRLGQRWSQSVREDHYLVGRVLHNI